MTKPFLRTFRVEAVEARKSARLIALVVLLETDLARIVLATLPPGGSVHGERANFTGLVLGCIDADFCK